MQLIEGAIPVQRRGLIDARIHNGGDAVRFGVTTELESMGRVRCWPGSTCIAPGLGADPIWIMPDWNDDVRHATH